MLGHVFERFVQHSPISVMVRGMLERVFGADQLDQFYERTAQKQYPRDLLFSTVYDLLSQVVFRVQPSVRAAYRAQQDDVATSVVSVYNKLKGIETHTSAELVRYSARELTPLIEEMGAERQPWLEGYRVKIVDGNCIEASEHRLKALREIGAGLGPYRVNRWWSMTPPVAWSAMYFPAKMAMLRNAHFLGYSWTAWSRAMCG
jgi:hypothetical protein